MRLGLSVWEPYRGLNLFGELFHEMFDDTAKPFSGFGTEGSGSGSWAPRVDIYEAEDSYVVSADLPGIKKEDIRIDLKDNILTISGETKLEEKSDKENYVRIERKYGKFVRGFGLSDNVDKEKIKANFSDGVLEIKVPKREEVAAKQIEVGVN